MEQKNNSSAPAKVEGKLRRNLTMFEATIYSISFVIGTGVFMKPAVVLQNTGSTGMAMLIWILGGLISMCSALTIAEIAAYIPKLGGLYTYIIELYGEFVGYIYGWVYMLIAGPGGVAAVGMAFATFASFFIDMNTFQLKALSIGAVVFCAVTQAISTKGSMRMQTIGTIAKLIPIFAIALFGVFKGSIPGAINLALVGNSPRVGIGVALLGVLWSFDGWQATCTLGNEMVKPEKNLPKSIILSLTFVTGVYLLFNFVIFKTVSADQILATTETSIGVVASRVLFGPKGAVLVSLGMLISAFTSLNAQIMAPTRYLLAMADKKQIIGANFLSHINPKYDTPINSLMTVVIMSIIYILSGTFNSVTDLVVFIIWVFFLLCVLGIFKLRKTYARDNSLYHVPLFPIIPILGAVGGCYLIVATLMGSLTTALIGVGVAVLGIPMYFYCKKIYGTVK